MSPLSKRKVVCLFNVPFVPRKNIFAAEAHGHMSVSEKGSFN